MNRSPSNGRVKPPARIDHGALDDLDPRDDGQDPQRAAEPPFSVPPEDRSGTLVSDYPPPPVTVNMRPFLWDADQPAPLLYRQLAACLAEVGDLYRCPDPASGLFMASTCPDVPLKEVISAPDLAPIITDRLIVTVIKDSKLKGSRIPASDLNDMLRSEVFLREFRPLDTLVKRPIFIGPDFTLIRPGYADFGRGSRVLYVGAEPEVATSTETIRQFLEVMAFASEADRTNAVAAALTVMLRNYWPGGKPMVLVTSNKSHAGKETLIEFFTGNTPWDSISYETADWAQQQAFVHALRANPEIGLVNVENVRSSAAGGRIGSPFLERFITAAEPTLFASGSGIKTSSRRPNHVIVAATSTDAIFIDDFLNRGVRIHLEQRGDIAARQSKIGNPKFDFLPMNRDKIEAEFRGMIIRWKDQDMPLDMEVRHSFTKWARVIGGILRVNGFKDFLRNLGLRKTADEPIRKALGLLGAARPAEWASARNWLPIVVDNGLFKALIPVADRETPKSQSRGLGLVLSKHLDETFEIETDSLQVKLKLEKGRHRLVKGHEAETCYRFIVLESSPIDDDQIQAHASISPGGAS
jgi:hypothetical protein